MLCRFFRTSLDTGKIQIMLKSAFISGILKRGSRSVHYRSISLISQVQHQARCGTQDINGPDLTLMDCILCVDIVETVAVLDKPFST